MLGRKPTYYVIPVVTMCLFLWIVPNPSLLLFCRSNPVWVEARAVYLGDNTVLGRTMLLTLVNIVSHILQEDDTRKLYKA